MRANAVAPALKRAQTQGVRVVSYDSDVAKNARGIFINQQQALVLVQAFPNLKGIIIPAGIGLPAAARALEQASLTFAAGRLGNYTIGENGEVILGPAVIVTPENVDKFKF